MANGANPFASERDPRRTGWKCVDTQSCRLFKYKLSCCSTVPLPFVPNQTLLVHTGMYVDYVGVRSTATSFDCCAHGGEKGGV